MEYKITTEYRHAEKGELFVENGQIRVSAGQWHSSCGRWNDQMGEVITSIEVIPVVVKSAPRKRTPKKELVDA